jgi:carboxypeptidase Taq
MDNIQKFRQAVIKQKAYLYVLNLAGWDSSTEAPHECFQRRAEMLGILNSEYFRLITAKKYQEIVNALFAEIGNYEDSVQREIKKAKKALDKIVKIPEKDFVAYQQLLNLSQTVWEDAKANNDFASFKANLAEIFRYNRVFVSYYGIDDEPYNVLLDEFEEGVKMEDYDKLFAVLRKELVPFVKQIVAAQKPGEPAFANAFCAKDKQKEFGEYLMKVMAFDRSRGVMKTSVHPFTWNTSPSDVRFTTHYLENNVFSAIFSSIHELGHASYEQQIDEKWDNTLLNGGTSMGIHESQSRFFENMIGRSQGFWEKHFPKLQELFPEQFRNVTASDVWRAVNKVELSMIRTEADELTYSLHVMLRYDIEKMLITDQIKVDDLPKVWNELMMKYLGVIPKNDTEGVLQDVHWSAGLIGYFPSYALGSAYAAQFYYAMKKDLDLDAIIQEADLSKIKAWLKAKIHHYGSSRTSKELLLEVTKEEFNPSYFVRYLKEKYTALVLN